MCKRHSRETRSKDSDEQPNQPTIREFSEATNKHDFLRIQDELD